MNFPSVLVITIITVCKNSEQFLTETINSVARQTYPNIEYIVIDGESTDGTLNIIQQQASVISVWISEKDTGMYDAINKGLKLATGDYILVLNSDDVLATDKVISDLATEIKKDRLDYYYGNIIKSKDGKNRKVKLFDVTFHELLFSTHGTFAPHPCFLIAADFDKALNGYDTNYKYAADYDYILRALDTKEKRGRHLDIYISKFRIHDNSITASGKIDAERKKILAQYGYNQRPYLSRRFYYYKLWIYYKIINISHGYKAG